MSDLKHATDNEGSSESSLESRAQVDPLLYEGPAKSWRIWAVLIISALIVVVVLYGLTPPTPHLYGPRAVPKEAKSSSLTSPHTSPVPVYMKRAHS